jgi:hypothetical protein
MFTVSLVLFISLFSNSAPCLSCLEQWFVIIKPFRADLNLNCVCTQDSPSREF